MPRRDVFFVAIAALVAGCAAPAPAPSPPAAPFSRLPPAVASRIDALMRAALEHQQLPGASLAIGRLDGTLLYANGYGFRNLALRARADRDTVYNIASMTKQFTAAAVLLLAQQHRLDLDATITADFPAAAYAGRVSIRELLTHTSGLPDYFCLPGYRAAMSDTDILAIAASEPLHFEPGTAYEYSNTNYVLLGRVVERIAREPYARFVRDRLLEPAHMRASRVGDVPGAGSDDALGYATDDGGPVPVTATSADLGFGAGAIDATAPDLVRWDAFLYGGALLDRTHLRRMLAARSYDGGATVRYGLGLHERVADGVREFYHRGRNVGYGGVSAVFPDDGLAIELLANDERFAPMLLVDELRALVRGGDRRAPAAPMPVDGHGGSRDERAKRWLLALAAGHVDRSELSLAAALRYPASAVAALATRIDAFGPLRTLTFVERDARCLGFDDTYRAVFERADVEYRFGVDHAGKVWNLALDRED